MATVYFTPITSGPRTATSQLALRTAAAPTTSYVATTNVVSVVGYEFIVFSIIYTNGDETSVELKPQLYDGTTWQDCGYIDAQASLVSALSPNVLQLVKADFSTTYGAATLANVACPPVLCLGFQQARMVVKSTGGTPTGTLGVTATAGIYTRGG